MCISEPTPVTIIVIKIESWSTCKEKSTLKEPTEIQLNKSTIFDFSSSGREIISRKIATAIKNEIATADVAIQPIRFSFLNFLPNKPLIKNREAEK